MTDAELLQFILGRAEFDPFNGHFELPVIPAENADASLRDALIALANSQTEGAEA